MLILGNHRILTPMCRCLAEETVQFFHESIQLSGREASTLIS